MSNCTQLGESDLATLQRSIAPEMHAAMFVYCTFADFSLPPGLQPICTFRESEGLTAVVQREDALRLGIGHQFESRLITLSVHSSLHAVGFIARVATALAAAGIACNAVSAFHHDHLFVPVDQADNAMRVLEQLARAEAAERV
jgi:uncharacterized protein